MGSQVNYLIHICVPSTSPGAHSRCSYLKIKSNIPPRAERPSMLWSSPFLPAFCTPFSSSLTPLPLILDVPATLAFVLFHKPSSIQPLTLCSCCSSDRTTIPSDLCVTGSFPLDVKFQIKYHLLRHTVSAHPTWRSAPVTPVSSPHFSFIIHWSCYDSFSFLFFFFSWPHHTACGILVPQTGIEPRPRQWKHQVLTTGPPGNSR